MGQRGRGKQRHLNRGLMGMDNGGIDCGSRWGGRRGKFWDNNNKPNKNIQTFHLLQP